MKQVILFYNELIKIVSIKERTSFTIAQMIIMDNIDEIETLYTYCIDADENETPINIAKYCANVLYDVTHN